MERKVLQFKASWYYAIKDLSKEIQLEVYMAILDYAFNRVNNADTLKPIAKAIFILIKNEIDNNQ